MVIVQHIKSLMLIFSDYDTQSNFNGSNTLGTVEISSRQG